MNDFFKAVENNFWTVIFITLCIGYIVGKFRKDEIL